MLQPSFNSSGIEVIGFDLDNTLYPVTPEINRVIQGYIYEHITVQRGVDLMTAEALFHEHYRYGAGLSGSASLRAIGIESEGVVQRALEEADVAAHLSPNIQTVELLEALKKRYQAIDLITGSDLNQTQRKLGALAILESTFEVVITGEQADKMSGQAYEAWLASYPELEPSSFAYVGDRAQLDHAIPSALGIRTVLVNVGSVDPSLICPQLRSLHDIRLFFLEEPH